MPLNIRYIVQSTTGNVGQSGDVAETVNFVTKSSVRAMARFEAITAEQFRRAIFGDPVIRFSPFASARLIVCAKRLDEIERQVTLQEFVLNFLGSKVDYWSSQWMPDADARITEQVFTVQNVPSYLLRAEEVLADLTR